MDLDWRLDVVVGLSITGAAIILDNYKQEKAYYYLNTCLLFALCLIYTFYLFGRLVDTVYRTWLLLRGSHWRSTDSRLSRFLYGLMTFLLKIKLLVFSIWTMQVYLNIGRGSNILVLGVTAFLYVSVIVCINPLLKKRYSIKLHVSVLLIPIGVFAATDYYEVVLAFMLILSVLLTFYLLGLALKRALVLEVEKVHSINGRPVGFDMTTFATTKAAWWFRSFKSWTK